MTILNLTRNALPELSKITSENIRSIQNMPENILRSLIQQGRKDIVHVDMNRCAAAVIKKDGVQTVFTDSLAGCNSVGGVIPLITGDNLCFLSHYVPTNRAGQVSAIEKQLKTYEPWIAKDKETQLFFNLYNSEKQAVTNSSQNPIIDSVMNLFNKFFAKKTSADITLYENSTKSFSSTANIFQFDTEKKLLKVTTVGEKEKFVTLV